MKVIKPEFLRAICCMAAGFLILAALALDGAELGDQSPKLQVEEWYNGGAVQLADGTNVCVVTFFESWCSSCMAALPQLNVCYQRFKDQGVTFAGVSVEPAETIKSFADEQSRLKALSFPVAGDKAHATYDAFMKAYGRTSVPNTFVIDSTGVILWEGPPLAGLEQALEQIVAHKYDLAQARKAAGAYKLQDNYFSVAAEDPSFKLLSDATNRLSAKEIGNQIVTDGASNPWLLNSFAWKILTDPKLKNRDLDLAIRASKLACESDPTKNPSFVDTYSRALYLQGKFSEAIASQKHAVEMASDPARRAQLEKTLKGYEELAKKGSH